jgi:hypothetical protein
LAYAPDIMDEVKEKFAKIYFTMQNDLRDRIWY